MSKRLPVPADLEHLIEKRDEENDRRGTGRRTKTSTERLSGEAPKGQSERRKGDRRRKPRRKAE